VQNEKSLLVHIDAINKLVHIHTSPSLDTEPRLLHVLNVRKILRLSHQTNLSLALKIAVFGTVTGPLPKTPCKADYEDNFDRISLVSQHFQCMARWVARHRGLDLCLD
jgi:hypothetical protein